MKMNCLKYLILLIFLLSTPFCMAESADDENSTAHTVSSDNTSAGESETLDLVVKPLNLSGSQNSCIPAGSSSGSQAEDDITWPSPVISSLYPDGVPAGSASTTFTIDGNYFIPETRILYDAKDYTTAYLSPYQMTATIPAYELGTPGRHFIWAYNPTPCGGNSNIVEFTIRDSLQAFPLTTSPTLLQVLQNQQKPGSIQTQDLSKGLQRFNLTLTRDPAAPFVFSFGGFPSWVSNPQVTWLNESRLLITGEDGGDRIRNGTGVVSLVNISVIGGTGGSGYVHCTLNEAIADDGTRYGSGYTALPVIVGVIVPFPDLSGGTFPPPTDPDHDGLYEDINGNERLDFNDIVILFQNTDFVVNEEPIWAFDFDQNQVINLNDVVALFRMTI